MPHPLIISINDTPQEFVDKVNANFKRLIFDPRTLHDEDTSTERYTKLMDNFDRLEDTKEVIEPQAVEAHRGSTTRNFPRVVILPIPHSSQRYETVGDYKEEIDDDGEHLQIMVSKLFDSREMWLVAIHELVEMALCRVSGIKLEEIDNFDIHYGDDLPGEPGDHHEAPYYRQHQIATGIERILAAEMGVDWTEYEKHLNDLYYKQET